MDQKTLVSAICDQADSFLSGVTKPEEAKAGIAEWVTIHAPKLAPEERGLIVAQAYRILADEGFFEVEAGRDG